MKLKDLVDKRFYGKNIDYDKIIRNICCDSRLAGPDSVFVCIKGSVTDGHLYARSAYNHGCRCFVAEGKIDLPPDCSILYTDRSRDALAYLSDILYGHPSGEIKVIGITGTKGKTTTALMISGILNKLGIPAGYIGSNGVRYPGFSHNTANTTPESCNIQHYLRDMIDSGVKYVVLEVSSQALYMDRVRYIDFDICIFTNISSDHIGEFEHPTFEHYRDCKASLFSEYKCNHIISNIDDINFAYITKNSKSEIDTFGLENPKARHTAKNICLYRIDNALGMSFCYVCGSEKYNMSIRLPGKFNIMNALAAVATCKYIGCDIKQIAEVIEEISVEGRFQIINALPYATVIIDYAHNGTSMKSALETLRLYNPARIITVFGSVGNRTKMRRSELGHIASQLSDYCIVTSDNPDTENPDDIIREIVASFDPDGCEHKSIADRKKAIEYGMEMLKQGDILLLAGKGHENYQLIKGRKVPFSEKEIVKASAGTILKSLV